MAKILCPNKQYTGVSGSVKFENGIGETDNKRLIAWFKRKGYTVEETASNNEPPKNLEDMNVKQLQAFAAENEIDVKGLKKKPEILEKIQAVLAEREDEDGEDEDQGDDEEDQEDEDEDGEES